MKHFFKLLTVGALLFGAVSCSQNQPTDKPADNAAEDSLSVADSTGGSATGKVHAIVTDAVGTPLDSVMVLTNGIELMTNDKGEFAIDKCPIINGRVVLRLQKAGFFDRIFSKELIDTALVNISMVKMEESDICQLTSFHSSKGTTVKVQNAMVEIPADAMVMMSDGSDYTGNVNISVIYYNPDATNFNELYPGGDLAAVNANGERGSLVSYGMLDVQMKTDKGELLQLKKGKKSKLNFPVPNCHKKRPEQIPLWWFNEKTGLWMEEGMSELKDSCYVGYVSHFTTWNCDVFTWGRYILEIQFIDKENKPVQAKIPFQLANDYIDVSRCFSTDENGYFRTNVGFDSLNMVVVGNKCHSLPVLKASNTSSIYFYNDSLAIINRFEIPFNEKIVTVNVKTVDEDKKPIRTYVNITNIGYHNYFTTNDKGEGKFSFIESDDIDIKKLEFNIWGKDIIKTKRQKNNYFLLCKDRPRNWWRNYMYGNSYSYSYLGGFNNTTTTSPTDIRKKVDLGFDEYLYKERYKDKNALYIAPVFVTNNLKIGDIFKKIKRIKRVSKDTFAITYKGSQKPYTYYWSVKNGQFGKMEKKERRTLTTTEYDYVFNIDIEDTTKSVVIEYTCPELGDTALYKKRIGIYKHYPYELEYEDVYGKTQVVNAKDFPSSNTKINTDKPVKFHLYYRDKEQKIDSLYISDVYKLEGPLLATNSNEIPVENLKLVQAAMEAQKNNQIYVQFVSRDLSRWISITDNNFRSSVNSMRRNGNSKSLAEYSLYGYAQPSSIVIAQRWNFK